MTNILEKIEEVKSKLETAQVEKIRITTQIEGLQSELEKLGFIDVHDAKETIAKMEDQIAELEDDLGEMLNDFESKYHKLLAN